MFIYISVFLVALAWYLIASATESTHSRSVLFLYMLAVALFVGFGDMIGGYDRYIYAESFDTIADAITYNWPLSEVEYLVNGHEYGYFYWQVLMGHVTENRYIFILFTTLLEYALIFLAIRKYCDDYPFATIIFLGFFYYFSMTYLREVIGVGIAWLGTKYIWERKPVPFFALLLLAASFHTSIIIFGVMYFLPFKKFTKVNIIVFLTVCLIAGLSPIGNAILGFAGDATGKGGDYVDQDQGFRIEYVMEVCFITFILFMNYDRIREDEKTLTFMNMCWALCGVLFIFMRFGQGGRFGWPFFLGLFYMFTTLCNDKDAFAWMKPLVITVCFALFMRITTSWNNELGTYKTFFSNGIPAAEYYYEQYEYDENYEADKFYRPAFRFINKD